MDDLFDTPEGQGPDGGGLGSDIGKSVEDAVRAAGGMEDLPDATTQHVFDPPPDWESYNAEQAKHREEDVAGGMDPTTAAIVNPDIDPENPYKIN